MMERLVKLFKKQITITLCAIICGFIVVAVILACTGYQPLEAFSILFQGIFSKPKYIVNVIVKATPIILTGLSVVFAFKVGLFNIGAEGEYIIGTIVATVVGILVDLPFILLFPLIVLSGVAAGALYGALIGFLKAKFGIHEVITGIMLNWIAFYGSNFIVTLDRFHKPDSSFTYDINQSGMDIIYQWKNTEAGKEAVRQNPLLLETVGKTDLNIGILLAVLTAIVIFIILKKTTKGYTLRSVGMNKEAARCAGIHVEKNMIHAMMIAGAVAGAAGALTVTGVSHNLMTLAVTENYGFNGLSVAMLSGNSPIGTIFAGLLFAGLSYGGGSIQSSIGAPSKIINIMIGTIVFFVAIANLFPMIVGKIAGREGRKSE